MNVASNSLGEHVQKTNGQPHFKSKNNRYALLFKGETKKQLKQMREEAYETINYVSEEQLEVSDEFFEGYTFPTRPEWTYMLNKEQLDDNETRFFLVNLSKTLNPPN